MKFPVKLGASEWLEFLSDAQERDQIRELKYHLDLKTKEMIIEFEATETDAEMITVFIHKGDRFTSY